MMELTGYFDGTVCIPYRKGDLKPQQKVIITVLDEYVPKKRNLKSFVGKISESDSDMIASTVEQERKVDENEW